MGRDRLDLIDELILLGYSDAEIAQRIDEPDFYSHRDYEEPVKKEKDKKKNKHNFRFGKRFIACVVAASIVGAAGIGGFHLYKKNEVARVKGYLEDFLTEDHYVDLSKISTDYDIRSFDGKYLYEALKDSDISYVRITSDYIFDIYDGVHVGPFKQMTGMNKSKLLGYDDNNNPVYDGYEPIRTVKNGKLEYVLPEEYELEEISVLAEPFDYERLMDREVVVRENNYEDSYTLSLEKKK